MLRRVEGIEAERPASRRKDFQQHDGRSVGANAAIMCVELEWLLLLRLLLGWIGELKFWMSMLA